MPRSLELKKTVNLPRTAFPMKAGLPKNEPRWLDFWREIDLYGRLRRARQGGKTFILHDGPPYANGHIHLGQALNKILKDIVVRSRGQMGFDAPYVPGWDCHGLPIENRVDRELGPAKKSLSTLEVRRRCRSYAERFIGVQREEFRRLGVLWDWRADAEEEAAFRPSREAIYRTLDHDYEAAIVRELAAFFTAGAIYYGKKPVHWCASCRTALAEAEVEYGPRVDPSVYVAFPLSGVDRRIPALAGRPVSAVIWTTTPWTLPANRALCFHPDFVYAAVSAGEGVYVVARDLVPAVAEALGWDGPDEVATFTGRQLVGEGDDWTGKADPPVVAEPPYREMTGGPASLLILGEHVTLDQGTGIVHTAPGHGADDYYVGARYGIEPWAPVDDDGRFLADMVPAWGGLQVFDANAGILEDLKSRGLLLAARDYPHDYPHCWRCRQAIVFRATPQWFIAMDRGGLRDKAVAAIHGARWRPAYGEDRIAGMIENRPDWCISRQRTWGVPIPVFACGACSTGDELVYVSDPALFEHVAGVFSRHGSDAWFGRVDGGEAAPYPDEAAARQALVPEGVSCPRCRRRDGLARRFEIVDVWFESGTSHAAVLARQGLSWPADLYLEGHDQYRGWFHSSLLVSVQGHDGQAPYRQVVTHGFTLDGEGRKMSKSLGNTVSPMDLADQRGADILRLWVSMTNFLEDMWISEESLTRHTDAYRKIRNTFRYILGNLSDFDPDRDAVPAAAMEELDRYILGRLDEARARVLAAYESYEFHVVAHTLNQFCGVTLSSFYLDIIKDRLYTEAPASPARRSAQTALWHLGHSLVLLVAPILCFTAEEVWQQLPRRRSGAESVHLELFPDATGAGDDVSPGPWLALHAVREAVAGRLEQARRDMGLGSGLQARVELGADGDMVAFADEFGLSWSDFMERFGDRLAEFLIVSEVRPGSEGDPIGDGPLSGLRIAISRHPGEKCPRCWTFVERLGTDPDYPEVCGRCAPRLAAGLAAGAWAEAAGSD